MPKDKVNENRLTIEYNEANPNEALEAMKKQFPGKKVKDLTQKEKDDLVAAVLATTNG